MTSLRSLCLLLSVSVVLPSYALAQGKGKSRQTFTARPGVTVDQVLRNGEELSSHPRVIVRYRPGAGRQLRQRLAAQKARHTRDHQGIGALSAEFEAKRLAALAADPDVLGLSIDAVVTSDAAREKTSPSTQKKSTPKKTQQPATSTPDYTLPEWFDSQALRSTLGIKFGQWGYDVGVAVIDSGIEPNPDIEGRISAFYDFTRGGVAAPATDDYGHGTHIAGLIAGTGKVSQYNYVGVALGVRLIGLKVLDGEGRGYASDVIAAIDFAVANRETLRIDVINLSLGHPIYEPAATDPLVQAVERAAAAGIVVVTSAGNNGYNPETGEIGYAGITSPGNAPSAITVGSLRTKKTASRDDDEVSKYSSRGPTWHDGFVKPDVLAPGQAMVSIGSVKSKLYEDEALRDSVTPYLKLSGTSMAAGVAAGVVALVIEAHRLEQPGAPPLTPNTIKAILQYTAIPVPDNDLTTPSILEHGTGGINAAGAMELARAIDPSMPVGSSWLQYGVVPVSLVGGESLGWAQHIIWGEHIVWGETIAQNLLAFALNITWGDDQHIVWGESFPQGGDAVAQSFSAWSEHIVWGEAASVVYSDDDGHIVWGDLDDLHIVWGENDEHIVWGEEDQRIIWGTASGLTSATFTILGN